MRNEKSEIRKYYKLLLLCFLAFSIIITACEPMEGSFEEVLEKALEGGKTGGDSKTPSVSVLQHSDFPAIYDGDVQLFVATANISNGTYSVTVANLPVGVTVKGNVTITNNIGYLILAGSLDTVAGTYSNLRLTINGVTSSNFTLTISPAGTKSVYVQGTQSAVLRRGAGGTVNYTLITLNITNNTSIILNTVVTGVTLTPVSTNYNSTTISINTTNSTPGGIHKLTVSVDGTTSPQFDLVVNNISVGSQIGTMYAGAGNQTVTFPVTTVGISNGNYTPVTVNNRPSGVTVSGSVNINNNSGTLTLAGSTATSAGNTTTLTLTFDSVTSLPFTLTIAPAKTITINTPLTADLWEKTTNSVTYSLTTSTSIGNGTYPATINPSITGVTGSVVISGSSKTLTLTGSSSAVIGDYTGRTITILSDGINVTSANTFTLRIIKNPSGDGSEGNPFLVPYIPEGGTVTNSEAVAALQKVGSGTGGWSTTAHYKQMMDINLTGVNWIPIYEFSGVYDGNGKTISNLHRSITGGYVGGIFITIAKSGIVKNVRLENITLSGPSRTGGVAGENYGTVQNCSVSGSVTCDQYGGGVVGLNYGTVKNCISSVNITGYQAGGVVGYNNSHTDNATLQNCYATGSVNGTEAGGVVGSYLRQTGSGDVANCVALNSSISGGGRVIGIGYHIAVNNYASSGIAGTWNNKGLNNRDGADVSPGTGTGQFNNQSWWSSGPSWTVHANRAAYNSAFAGNKDTSPWVWSGSPPPSGVTANLPVLWFMMP